MLSWGIFFVNIHSLLLYLNALLVRTNDNEPQPEKGVNGLVVHVHVKGALNRVVLHVAKNSHLEVAKGHARKPAKTVTFWREISPFGARYSARGLPVCKTKEGFSLKEALDDGQTVEEEVGVAEKLHHEQQLADGVEDVEQLDEEVPQHEVGAVEAAVPRADGAQLQVRAVSILHQSGL